MYKFNIVVLNNICCWINTDFKRIIGSQGRVKHLESQAAYAFWISLSTPPGEHKDKDEVSNARNKLKKRENFSIKLDCQGAFRPVLVENTPRH